MNREEKRVELQKYFTLLRVLGADEAEVIDPASVVTAPWPAFRCQYGCATYGKSFCCPPRTPDYSRMRQIIDCYETAVLFHFRRMGNLTEVAQKTARQMFLDGYYKVIALGSGPCRLCKTCALAENLSGAACPYEEDEPAGACGSADCAASGMSVSPESRGVGGGFREPVCRFPEKAIPAMEACGIDVYATARASGFPIATLSDKDEPKNFYGLILVE